MDNSRAYVAPTGQYTETDVEEKIRKARAKLKEKAETETREATLKEAQRVRTFGAKVGLVCMCAGMLLIDGAVAWLFGPATMLLVQGTTLFVAGMWQLTLVFFG